VGEIYRETARQIALQKAEAAKTAVANSLWTRVYDHTVATADGFYQRTYQRIESPGRSKDCQATFEDFCEGALAHYKNDIHNILAVGANGINRELGRSTEPPKPQRPERQGFFAWLFG
jgi:hypothetical protein